MTHPLPVSLLLLLCGCAHHGSDEPAKHHTGMDRIWYEELSVIAAERLDCARDELEYRYLGDKVHVVEGCGRQTRYLIFERDSLWVKIESFHERAAFELECAVDQLLIQKLSENSWRVFGCGRQTGYALSCDQGHDLCDWVVSEPVREGG